MKKHLVCVNSIWGKELPKDEATNVGLISELAFQTTSQRIHYHESVPVPKKRVERLFNNTLGNELRKTISDSYHQLCSIWEEGDSLSGVGFSKGSYILRALTEIVGNYGIAKDEITAKKILHNAYSHRPRNKFSIASQSCYTPSIDAIVTMDTIGPKGIPQNTLIAPFQRRHELKNTQVNKKVDNLLNIIALDENHFDYMQAYGKDSQNIANVILNGSHKDIGGIKQTPNWSRGYHDLSNISLQLAIEFLQNNGGISFDSSYKQFRGNSKGKINNDSPILQRSRSLEDNLLIDNSVVERINSGEYSPSHFPPHQLTYPSRKPLEESIIF